MAVGKIYMEKGERNYHHVPIILRLCERISNGEGEENQNKKNSSGEEYQVVGNFIKPWSFHE